jgi:hypothetical protein
MAYTLEEEEEEGEEEEIPNTFLRILASLFIIHFKLFSSYLFILFVTFCYCFRNCLT